MNSLLAVTELTRRFGARVALCQLGFELDRGEVLGLLGPNGAGKSTCLQCLSGNLAPTSGRVLIGGIDLWREPRRAKARLGYLPERAPVYPELRLDEYLTFAARLRGLRGPDLTQALTAVKAHCGLEAVGRRLLGRLSKGYRQRAGLAQALLHRPDLIILDEPTDGLDPVQCREMRGLIRELTATSAVLLSSHALAEVQAVCTRVIILSAGRELYRARLAGTEPADAGWLVRLRPPPTLATLAALPMVATALPALDADGRHADPSAFQVRLRDSPAAAAAPAGAQALLARALVERGFCLLELSPRRTDLERLFFREIGLETGP
ncbi:MAG: ABC transporter ATP-binding protein [Chromatiaceae bacterium]|nr:MAG: ABC transporter ATP-binding protein [Chromatiaceae bacterium]